MYSRLSTENINNRRFWIRKNKFSLRLINNQPDIDQIYLYATDSCESKYQYLVNKYEKVGSKHYDDHKAFIDYANVYQMLFKCKLFIKILTNIIVKYFQFLML